jgi:hypothetical protein
MTPLLAVVLLTRPAVVALAFAAAFGAIFDLIAERNSLP